MSSVDSIPTVQEVLSTVIFFILLTFHHRGLMFTKNYTFWKREHVFSYLSNLRKSSSSYTLQHLLVCTASHSLGCHGHHDWRSSKASGTTREERHKQSTQCNLGHDWYHKYCVRFLHFNNGSRLFVSSCAVPWNINPVALMDSMNLMANPMTKTKVLPSLFFSSIQKSKWRKNKVIIM